MLREIRKEAVGYGINITVNDISWFYKGIGVVKTSTDGVMETITSAFVNGQFHDF